MEEVGAVHVLDLQNNCLRTCSTDYPTGQGRNQSAPPLLGRCRRRWIFSLVVEFQERSNQWH